MSNVIDGNFDDKEDTITLGGEVLTATITCLKKMPDGTIQEVDPMESIIARMKESEKRIEAGIPYTWEP